MHTIAGRGRDLPIAFSCVAAVYGLRSIKKVNGVSPVEWNR